MTESTKVIPGLISEFKKAERYKINTNQLVNTPDTIRTETSKKYLQQHQKYILV